MTGILDMHVPEICNGISYQGYCQANIKRQPNIRLKKILDEVEIKSTFHSFLCPDHQIKRLRTQG